MEKLADKQNRKLRVVAVKFSGVPVYRVAQK